MQRVLSVAVAAVAALSSISGVLAAPVLQANPCPVAADEVVSQALGAPAQILDPSSGVTLNGANTECLFLVGGQLVLVKLSGDFFPESTGPTATPEQVDQLRKLVVDEVDYVPVSGVGDAALWATVRDRTLAPGRMAVLITKRGVDAFVIGVMDTPDALVAASTLTRAVMDARGP